MRRAAACGLALCALLAGGGASGQTRLAGTPGSALEPWQEGGAPVGATAVPSLATTVAAMPKNLPRADAPGLDESIAAARAAVRACAAKRAPVSALVTDAVGEPVVLLSGDGAGVRSQLIARTKANIVVRYKTSSQNVADRLTNDPTLVADAAADPAIGMIRGGGLPVMRGGRMIGAVAVSGGSLANGDLTLDETCARAAQTYLQRRGGMTPGVARR